MLGRIAIAAVIVGGLLCGIPARHVFAHTGTYLVDAGNGLNLRTGPGGQYRRILTMPNGASVTAMGHRGNWMKIRYRATGAVGWAWIDYLVPAGSAPTGGGGDPPTGLQTCFDTTFAWTACAPLWIAQTVFAAAVAYGVAYWALMQTAACESAFDPYAYNPISGVTGLFQFQPSTFYWQGGTALYSVYDQAQTAARMFARGLAAHFACAIRIGYA